MPIADFINQMYGRIGKIAQQYPQADPQAVTQALGAGGSLSNSLGFNEPSELMGLTPEMFQKSMDMRTTIQNNLFSGIKQAAELNDMFTGNKEARAAAYGLVPNELSALTQESIQGQSDLANMERTKVNEAGATLRSRENNATQIKTTAMSNATQIKTTGMSNATSLKIANMHERGANARADRELKKMEQMANSSAQKEAVAGYKAMQGEFGLASKIMASKNTSKEQKLQAAQDIQSMMPNLIEQIDEGGWGTKNLFSNPPPTIKYKETRITPMQGGRFRVDSAEPMTLPNGEKVKVWRELPVTPYEYFRLTQRAQQ